MKVLEFVKGRSMSTRKVSATPCHDCLSDDGDVDAASSSDAHSAGATLREELDRLSDVYIFIRYLSEMARLGHEMSGPRIERSVFSNGCSSSESAPGEVGETGEFGSDLLANAASIFARAGRDATPITRLTANGPISASDLQEAEAQVEAQMRHHENAIVEEGARPPERLSFDGQCHSVTLDGRTYQLSVKAFELYKLLSSVPAGLTRCEIGDRLKGFRGQKAVPKVIMTLPHSLRATVRSNTRRGYYVVLSSGKDVQS